MFQKNMITNIVQKVTINNNYRLVNMLDIDTFANTLGSKIHSLIVYNVFNNDKLVQWEIHYNISQTNKYNTITVNNAVKYLKETLSTNVNEKNKYVNCYLQPSLDLIIKLRKYLIVKLAKEQKQRWQWLEFEDLVQMCNLVICDLYYKGYYIHD